MILNGIEILRDENVRHATWWKCFRKNKLSCRYSKNGSNLNTIEILCDESGRHAT